MHDQQQSRDNFTFRWSQSERARLERIARDRGVDLTATMRRAIELGAELLEGDAAAPLGLQLARAA